ncbi:hypothetical protein [Rhodoferax sp.]|uniref:hypothetical protein n=1 Tax=Rhodoferax sp. TaxID=50421 RepID=UPI00275BFFF2|nr:hypothetical protein [Rhodoferax sp.]
MTKKEGGCYISARNFIELGLPAHWSAPVFIDGLDEVTRGNAPGSTALGQIRSRLHVLGIPNFRISCREADWRGSADSAALQYLVGDGNFLELHLEPLDLKQITALIMHWQGSSETSATDFIREAKQRDLGGLLDNPQTLRMLVKAVGALANTWPDSKTEAYEIACQQLVREHNKLHIAALRSSPLTDDDLLQAAVRRHAVIGQWGYRFATPRRPSS